MLLMVLQQGVLPQQTLRTLLHRPVHVVLPHPLDESARAVPRQKQGQLRQAESLQALQILDAM